VASSPNGQEFEGSKVLALRDNMQKIGDVVVQLLSTSLLLVFLSVGRFTCFASDDKVLDDIKLDGKEIQVEIGGLIEGVATEISLTLASASELNWRDLKFESSCGCASIRLPRVESSQTSPLRQVVVLLIKPRAADFLQRIDVCLGSPIGPKLKSIVVKGKVATPFVCDSLEVSTDELLAGKSLVFSAVGDVQLLNCRLQEVVSLRSECEIEQDGNTMSLLLHAADKITGQVVGFEVRFRLKGDMLERVSYGSLELVSDQSCSLTPTEFSVRSIGDHYVGKVIFKDKRIKERKSPVFFSLQNSNGQLLKLKPQVHFTDRILSNGWVIVTFRAPRSTIVDFAKDEFAKVPYSLKLIALDIDEAPLCEASLMIED